MFRKQLDFQGQLSQESFPIENTQWGEITVLLAWEGHCPTIHVSRSLVEARMVTDQIDAQI